MTCASRPLQSENVRRLSCLLQLAVSPWRVVCGVRLIRIGLCRGLACGVGCGRHYEIGRDMKQRYRAPLRRQLSRRVVELGRGGGGELREEGVLTSVICFAAGLLASTTPSRYPSVIRSFCRKRNGNVPTPAFLKTRRAGWFNSGSGWDSNGKRLQLSHDDQRIAVVLKRRRRRNLSMAVWCTTTRRPLKTGPPLTFNSSEELAGGCMQCVSDLA